MPSSEECIAARGRVYEWALNQLRKEGHPIKSAIEIVNRMDYNERVAKAELWLGEKIYRGAYSPYR